MTKNVDRLPNKYETTVGERGCQLSGGQQQRIAIARAILARPEILILDEAMSNLDSDNEHLIAAALSNLVRDRTTFVVAHRLSTIRNADCIIVLEDGELRECGTHAGRRSSYYGLVMSQLGLNPQRNPVLSLTPLELL